MGFGRQSRELSSGFHKQLDTDNHRRSCFYYTGDLNQMERKEKGLLYRVGDPEIRKLQNRQLVLLADYNRMNLLTGPAEGPC
jgi:hypothetical protein